VQKSLQSSDAVFVGEMVRGGVGDPDPTDDDLFGGIEFRAVESWKGISGDSVVLYGQETAYFGHYGESEEGQLVPMDSCLYPFEKGKRYLIYATGSEDSLQTDICTRTTTLANSDKDLQVLGPTTEQLTDTGGLPLPSVSVVVGAAGLISAGLLFRWARS
jgi:hypothetical protein